MFKTLIQWLDDRTGIPTGCAKIRDAMVPPGHTIKLIPAAIVWAFFLQVTTGIVMWLFYTPSAQTAWESIYYIQYKVPGGAVIRGIHHFSAQMLVALLVLQVLAMILTGRYRKRREFVLWTSMILFCFTLMSCLTGDLLSWSISGYSSTAVRVKLLYQLPFGIGDWLFKLAIGGPGEEFGTMTLTRFLLLHILVCGGGFFGFLCLWRWFEHRARKLDLPDLWIEQKSYVPYWNNEVLKSALVCLLVSAIVLFLVYQKPILKKADPDLPPEASIGPEMYAPGGPGFSYDAARPEWPFRAIYIFSNIKKTTVNEKGETTQEDFFPGDKKYIPIFIVTGLIAFFFFLIPLIGKPLPGHVLCVLVTLGLFGGACYLTYASFKHDAEDAEYHKGVAKAEITYKRSLELAGRPEGIPPAGVLSLIKSDPKLQGPALFELHCVSCHAFTPQAGMELDADFPPIIPESPDYSAPNLYKSISAEWIEGYLDLEKLQSDDYFGKTAFRRGSMYEYLKEQLPEIAETQNDLIAIAEEEGEPTDEVTADVMIKAVVKMLHNESKLTTIREKVGNEYPGLSAKELTYWEGELLDCTQCHKFYSDTRPKKAGPDLRGYMSKDWLIGIISNPADPKYYGSDNDRMPAYYPNEEDALMTKEQIEILADWLHGKWYRPAEKE